MTFYETLRGQLEAATVALRTTERDEADARRVAAEARLAWLESRVNPHFLFNTLNSIAALTHDNPSGAERMTNQLASLMRSSLDAGPASLIPLGEEVGVARDYLEIERVAVRRSTAVHHRCARPRSRAAGGSVVAADTRREQRSTSPGSHTFFRRTS